MAISLLVISINTSLALEFQLISPESVNAKESFTVSIEASTSEKYDVKITVQDSNKKIISEIYNDGWKNPYYYLKSIFPDQKEFKIRVTGNPGKYDICARLRKTGKTSFTEQCKEINVNQAINPDSDIEKKSETKSSKKAEKDADEDDDEEDENDEKDNEDEEDEDQKESNIRLINNSQTTNKQYESLSLQKKEEPIKEEKIMLNEKNQSLERQTTLNTKYQTQQIYILYFFLAVCIVIIILLVLKRL